MAVKWHRWVQKDPHRPARVKEEILGNIETLQTFQNALPEPSDKISNYIGTMDK